MMTVRHDKQYSSKIRVTLQKYFMRVSIKLQCASECVRVPHSKECARIYLKGKSICLTCAELFTALLLAIMACVSASFTQQHVMLCTLILYLSFNQSLNCLQDSQIYSRFTVLSIDSLGVGCSFQCLSPASNTLLREHLSFSTFLHQSDSSGSILTVHCTVDTIHSTVNHPLLATIIFSVM